MKEKTIDRMIWAVCLIVPLFPTFIVLIIVHPLLSIFGNIVVCVIEYFGFMYALALFITRLAERKMNKDMIKHIGMKKKTGEI